MHARRADLAAAGAALAAVAVGAVEARRPSVRATELRWFAGVNSASERARLPLWVLMQLGSLGGSIATGAAVGASGRPRLGHRLTTVGSLAWLGSKAVKPFAHRARPALLVEATRVLGREQAGLGYPSGHAAVAVGMALAAAPHVPPAWRAPCSSPPRAWERPACTSAPTCPSTWPAAWHWAWPPSAPSGASWVQRDAEVVGQRPP